MNDSKPFYASVGIMGPLAALTTWGLNQAFPGLGLVVTDISPIIDNAALIAGSLTGIWGRWRATRSIG